MFQQIASTLKSLSRRYVPHPLVFAVFLSAIVFARGLVLTPASPQQMLDYWYGGLWNLLAFTMQVTCILLFGYALANSAPCLAVLRNLSKLPKTRRQAIFLILTASSIITFFNWAVSLIAGAIIAREVCIQAKGRGLRIHYPLAVAASFSGQLVNIGLSSSPLLLINTDNHFLIDQIGLIPITETALSVSNLIVFVLFVILVSLACCAAHPKEDAIREVSQEAIDRFEAESAKITARPDIDAELTPAQRLENSQFVTWLITLPGYFYIFYYFYTNGFNLNLNIVNFIFLVIGLSLHRTPASYITAVNHGISSCGQVILQFPFYAGIMGMMAGSGLITIFANSLAGISTATTLPFMTMLSASVVNFMVPSAGGQWAVQGPIVVQAAAAAGADLHTTILGFVYGDMLTNAIQPMWMLPLLGLVAVEARDILGYTAIMMITAFFIYSSALLIF